MDPPTVAATVQPDEGALEAHGRDGQLALLEPLEQEPDERRPGVPARHADRLRLAGALLPQQ